MAAANQVPTVCKLERFFAENTSKGRYHLCGSDVEALTMKELLEMADSEMMEAWNNLKFSYTECKGSPLLRSEAASLHGVSADDVLVIVPQEGIYIAMHCLANLLSQQCEGKFHAIATYPAYQSLYENLRTLNCNLDYWTVEDTESGWEFRLDRLRELLRPETRLLVVNFPHNPTGFVPTRQQWGELVELCREREIYLFSDEMYRLTDNASETAATATKNDQASATDDAATKSPDDAATKSPDDAPTKSPDDAPTKSPDDAPTKSPDDAPTKSPDDAPTKSPDDAPTKSPDDAQTRSPDDAPTKSIDDAPTKSPDDAPTKSTDAAEAGTCESACAVYERAVTLCGMSKTFAMAGLRIGWLATRDRRLMASMQGFKDYITICSPGPCEILATIGLRNRDKILERTLGILRQNLELLDQWFPKYADLFKWHKPKACTTGFLELKSWLLEFGEGGATGFCKVLLQEAEVLPLPADIYDFSDRYVRFSFGRSDMPQVLQVFEDFIEKHKAQRGMK